VIKFSIKLLDDSKLLFVVAGLTVFQRHVVTASGVTNVISAGGIMYNSSLPVRSNAKLCRAIAKV
jgi:hypothetical protein